MAKKLIGNGVAKAFLCQALGIPQSCLYRWLKGFSTQRKKSTSPPANSLSSAERQQILNVLHDEEYIEETPYEIVPKLLDKGIYLASIRTFYRILASVNELRERRNQRRNPKYVKPVLKATAPNQVWSWDITRLPGPYKGIYYYLYVMIDIFSRFVVGWMVSNRENAHLAQHFIRETVRNNGPLDEEVVVHSDNGPQMKAGGTIELLSLLGLVQSFSRPRVSDDNPYSESQFKTLKYHRFFPEWFSSQEFAEHKMEQLFHWYNYEHMHTGLNLLTPHMVHYGLVDQVVTQRQLIMDQAVENHPERFSHASTEVKHNPGEVYINFNPKVNERNYFELSLDK